jgi:hypothetical protein
VMVRSLSEADAVLVGRSSRTITHASVGSSYPCGAAYVAHLAHEVSAVAADPDALPSVNIGTNWTSRHTPTLRYVLARGARRLQGADSIRDLILVFADDAVVGAEAADAVAGARLALARGGIGEEAVGAGSHALSVEDELVGVAARA